MDSEHKLATDICDERTGLGTALAEEYPGTLEYFI